MLPGNVEVAFAKKPAIPTLLQGVGRDIGRRSRFPKGLLTLS
jgi:hypothetical protein